MELLANFCHNRISNIYMKINKDNYMTNAETISKLNEALEKLITGYEELQNSYEQLQDENNELNNENNNLKEKITLLEEEKRELEDNVNVLQDSTEKDSGNISSMLDKIEGLLNKKTVVESFSSKKRRLIE